MSSGHEADPRAQRLRELLVPDRCAVLVQELQEGVVGSISRLTALAEVVHESSLIPHAAKVVGVARRSWSSCDSLHRREPAARSGTQYQCSTVRRGAEAWHGQPAWLRFCSAGRDLGPFDTDIVLPRFHGLSPLTGSALDSLLRNSGVRALVVMGVSLNVAIPNLVFDAVNRAYQVVLVSDAVAGVPQEYGAQMIEHTLSLVCTLASSEEIRRCLGVNSGASGQCLHHGLEPSGCIVNAR